MRLKSLGLDQLKNDQNITVLLNRNFLSKILCC